MCGEDAARSDAEQLDYLKRYMNPDRECDRTVPWKKGPSRARIILKSPQENPVSTNVKVT